VGLGDRVRRVLGRGPKRRVPADVVGRPLAPGVDLRAFKESHMFPVLDHPPRVAAAHADLQPNALVLCVEKGKESVVYPVEALSVHHIVNDEIAGQPIAIAFCQKCYSGVAHRPVVEGTVLTFETGGTYRGAMLMRDRSTGTRWSHVTGEALIGSFVGRRLEPEVVAMGTVESWLADHPEAATLDPAGLRRTTFARPGPERAASVSSKNPHWDRRLPGRTLVLGVDVGEASRAYVVDPIEPGPALFQDEISGVPIALLAAPGRWPTAFDRRRGEHTVVLSEGPEGIRDDEGSLVAVGSPAGERAQDPGLRFVPSQLIEWHAWAAYHPETDVVDLRD